MLEHALDFALIARFVDISLDRLRHHRRRLVGGAVAVVSECTARESEHFFMACHGDVLGYLDATC